MSVRPSPVLLAAICATILLVPVARGADQDASKSSSVAPPAAQDRLSADRSADAPLIGAVERALIRLYRIPRPVPRQFGSGHSPSSQPALTGPDGATRDSKAGHSDPRIARPDEHRLGLQHADAIRDSISDVPIDDDLHREATGKTSEIVQPRDPGPPVDRRASLTATLVGPSIDGYYGSGYYRPGPRLSSKDERWTDYRYYDGRPSAYGHGRYDREYNLDDSIAGQYFRFGFIEGYDRGRFEREGQRRTQSLLSNSNTQLSRGLAWFHSGDYQQAAKAFKLAADMNHGDPASRIYAAHALFAIGRYKDGIEHLRRAFQLQPKIALLTYDLRDDYGKRADFDQQVEALETALKMSPRNMDRLVMLAYIHGYSGQPQRSYEVLAKAKKVDADDPLVKLLMEHAQPPDVLEESLKRGSADAGGQAPATP